MAITNPKKIPQGIDLAGGKIVNHAPISEKTGTNIVFTEDAYYNKATPLVSGDGNLFLDVTGAVSDVGVLIYIDRYAPLITSNGTFLIPSNFDVTKFHVVLVVWNGDYFTISINKYSYLEAPLPTAITGNNNIIFNDFNVTNATEYEIEFSTIDDQGTAVSVPTYNGTDTDYTHTGLTNGATYYHWFRAIGNGYLSSIWRKLINTPTSAISWQLASFAYNNVSTPTGDPTGQSLAFKPDGTKMYIGQSSANVIAEFDLSIPWDLTTSVLNQVNGTGLPSNFFAGLFFNPTGTKIFVSCQTARQIWQSDLSVAWDISTYVGWTNTSIVLPVNCTAIFIKPDGTEIYQTNLTDGIVRSYTCTTPWDVTTMVALATIDLSASDSGFRGLFFKDDGTKMYIYGESNVEIYEFNLSVAWDITTALYSGTSLSTSPEGLTVYSINFKPDGLQFFTIDLTSDTVMQYIAS